MVVEKASRGRAKGDRERERGAENRRREREGIRPVSCLMTRYQRGELE